MTKQLWLNLPVKDVKKSKAFFSHLGFRFNSGYGDTDVSAAMEIGDNKVIVMLFQEETFKGFVCNELADSKAVSEILLSFDAESKKEVDEILSKAEEAGGTIFGKPQDAGWMYGGGFTDLDAHRWNVLFMDMSLMPK